MEHLRKPFKYKQYQHVFRAEDIPRDPLFYAAGVTVSSGRVYPVRIEDYDYYDQEDMNFYVD